MIARLKGALHRFDADRVLVDVAGVGYEVHVSRTTFADLPADGTPVSLDIYTSVREDAIQLYGFGSREEKGMFLRLNQVSGIGPKLALSILSGLSARELASAIARGDVKRLTQVPHVGKRTAERIVVELKDKLGMVVELPVTAAAGPHSAPVLAGPVEEARSALLNLGYRPAEAEAALSEIPPDATEVGEIVRRALKGMAVRVGR